ncbi:T9SS type A sorting domain-containing protein [Flavobacterium sp. J27]|uniref:T9SS type A sorting domain-containing protein n=1 Tax=Flavobacterium sp. J27 TaxID=2060419 RepID=UPI0010319DE6|nr:T9SS type A sorting domain-containing protein [Flavobacterium sp. J27]
MNILKTTLALLLLLLHSNNNYSQAPYGSAGQQTAVYLNSSNGIPFGYYEYLPQNFTPTSGTSYPVLIFYHGIGEKGNGTTELYKVLANGTPKQIQQGMHFPAIVISPQKGSGWFSGADFLTLYNYLLLNYPIDTNRVYITGLSAGGGGVWQALNSHHDKIAAAVPICGAGSISNPALFLQNTNIWIHHNFGDTTVQKTQSINNANRIANNSETVMDVYPYGANNTAATTDFTMQFDTNTQTWTGNSGVAEPIDRLCFTLYKANGHNAWSTTYNNPSVYDWMFSKTLNIALSNPTFENHNMTVYPNPTKDIIRFSKNIISEAINIYDISGKKISSGFSIQANTIDISSFENGIYFLKLKNQTFKIVKN